MKRNAGTPIGRNGLEVSTDTRVGTKGRCHGLGWTVRKAVGHSKVLSKSSLWTLARYNLKPNPGFCLDSSE